MGAWQWTTCLLCIGTVCVTLGVIFTAGEEEEEYWHKVVDSMPAKGKRGGKGGRGGKRGRGRGGMKGGQFRKRRQRTSGGEGADDGEGEEPPEAKAVKLESED